MRGDKKLIVQRLLALRNQLHSEGKLRSYIAFTKNETIDEFLSTNFNAFLIGVICDQGIKAEKAWSLPYLLRERLGHLDPAKLVAIGPEKLGEAMARPPALHRFNRNMARYICESSKLLMAKYGGDAARAWSDHPTSRALFDRLVEFKGIGQKKAAMAVEILAKYYGVPIQDPSGIDVAYDVHVRRVFLRAGLAEHDTPEEVINAARKVHPEYPGALDYPAWHIGRMWCRPTNPRCRECPLGAVCPSKPLFTRRQGELFD